MNVYVYMNWKKIKFNIHDVHTYDDERQCQSTLLNDRIIFLGY